MNCNCKWTEGILAVILIVFSIIVNAAWSKWVVFGVGVILLLHAFFCKNCSCKVDTPKPSKGKKR